MIVDDHARFGFRRLFNVLYRTVVYGYFQFAQIGCCVCGLPGIRGPVFFIPVSGSRKKCGCLRCLDYGRFGRGVFPAAKDDMALLKRDADFLKVGHHGSKYAATKDYLAGLSLQAAVISVGENSYGHPTEETLGRLASENIDIYRTDCDGAVILQLYQNSTQIYEYAG